MDRAHVVAIVAAIMHTSKPGSSLRIEDAEMIVSAAEKAGSESHVRIGLLVAGVSGCAIFLLMLNRWL